MSGQRPPDARRWRLAAPLSASYMLPSVQQCPGARSWALRAIARPPPRASTHNPFQIGPDRPTPPSFVRHTRHTQLYSPWQGERSFRQRARRLAPSSSSCPLLAVFVRSAVPLRAVRLPTASQRSIREAATMSTPLKHATTAKTATNSQIPAESATSRASPLLAGEGPGVRFPAESATKTQIPAESAIPLPSSTLTPPCPLCRSVTSVVKSRFPAESATNFVPSVAVSRLTAPLRARRGAEILFSGRIGNASRFLSLRAPP